MIDVENNYVISRIENELSLVYEDKIKLYNPEKSYIMEPSVKSYMCNIAQRSDNEDKFSILSQFSNMMRDVMLLDETTKKKKYSYVYKIKGREENERYVNAVMSDRLWLIDTIRSTPYYCNFISEFRENSKNYLRDLSFKRGVLEGKVKKIGELYYFTLNNITYNWIHNRRHYFEDCKPLPISKAGRQPVSLDVYDDYDNESYITLKLKEMNKYYPTYFKGKSSIYKGSGKDAVPMSDDELQRYMTNITGENNDDEEILRLRDDNPSLPWRLAYEEDVISPWAECDDIRYTLKFYIEENNLTKVTTRLFGRPLDVDRSPNKDVVEPGSEDKLREMQWKEANKDKYNCEACGYKTNNKTHYGRHCKTKKHARNTSK